MKLVFFKSEKRLSKKQQCENNLLRCVIKVDVTCNSGFYSLNRDDMFMRMIDMIGFRSSN